MVVVSSQFNIFTYRTLGKITYKLMNIFFKRGGIVQRFSMFGLKITLLKAVGISWLFLVKELRV